MVKNHLKRIAMPKTWTTVERKSIAWAPKVNPGAHNMNDGMPILLVFRELLKSAETAREIRVILNQKTVLVDGTRRKNQKFNIGLMDTLSIPETKEYYRISLNKHGKLVPVKIDEKESLSKICKITGKGLYEGKTQLRLNDGRVILLDKKSEYKTSDSIIIKVPEQKIVSHIPFEKGVTVLVTGGKKIGAVGMVEEIKDKTAIIKIGNEKIETNKEYCFVVGKGKPELTIENGK